MLQHNNLNLPDLSFGWGLFVGGNWIEEPASLRRPLSRTFILGVFRIANSRTSTSAGVFDPDPVSFFIEIVPLSLLNPIHRLPRRLEIAVEPNLLNLFDLSFLLPVRSELDLERTNPGIH